MVIICPTLRISGCAQGSSELSYRQVAARDFRVPEGIHSVSCTYCSSRCLNDSGGLTHITHYFIAVPVNLPMTARSWYPKF